MLSLTSTLLAAQRSASAAPAVQVRLRDCDAGVSRLRFARWYTGAEPDGPCAVAVPADGSLVRARIDPSSGTLYAQRVATPTSSSTYFSWTSLGTVLANARLGCHAAGTRVLIGSVRSGGAQVEVRESSDSGATFGASTVVATAASTVTAVACAIREDGSAALIWAAGGVVYSSRRSGLGAWGAAAAWSRSLATVNGLAMTDSTDYGVLVSGTDAAGAAGAWSTRYGSGVLGAPGSWTPLVEVASASAGTLVTYLATAVAEAGGARLVFVETFAGIGAYARVQTTEAIALSFFEDGLWRSARPLEITSAYGVAMAGGVTAGAGHAYLASPAGVWHASADAPLFDVSPDVLEARLDEGERSARLRVRLRNDDGRYNTDAAPLPLAPGGELLFDPGYATTAGIEVASGRTYAITAVRRVRDAGRAYVDVEAEGAWGILARWRAPRQFTWASGASSARAVLRDIARRAGCFLDQASPSAEATALLPAYTVRADERGDTALASLLDRLPDVLRASGTHLALTEPLASEAATYAYGIDHGIESLRMVEEVPDAGWARVFGDGNFAEAPDLGAIARGAGAAIVVDDNLGSTAHALTRASAVLRKAALAADAGELVARPNVGHEVGDVVAITDATLGLDAAPFRVRALRLEYVASGPRGPRYAMTLSLGPV